VRVMASLVRLIQLRLRQDERGAIAIIVAILIGGGVLTGMGAFVIDVGQVFQERDQLQNGAESGAIGVAKSCALGDCTPEVAQQLADANAGSLTGGTAGVPLVCGSGGLGGCPAPTGAITDCPGPPQAGANYVDVHTATLTSGGSTLLPPVFARTLLGNSSYQGTNVQACSQAEWGPPATATTDAIAISACEWDQDTQQGADFAPAPPYGVGGQPAASFDQVLTVDLAGNGAGCATEPAGAAASRLFGWANDATGNCSLPVSAPSFNGPAGGSGVMSAACEQVLQNAQQSQVPIQVPVYMSYSAGTNIYNLQGFADFVVTGYDLPGFPPATDWLNLANTCTVANCVDGYFVQGLSTATGNIGGPDLGLSIIDLTG
jgi:Flp pilus assembly protein TadG